MRVRDMALSGLALMAGLALAAGAASAQKKPARDHIAETIASVALDDHSARVGDIRFVEIREGESLQLSFDVDPAKMYFVYGACDRNCSDINLLALDSDDYELDKDLRPDATPIISIGAGMADDRLSVRINMVGCRAPACLAGIALYRVDI